MRTLARFILELVRIVAALMLFEGIIGILSGANPSKEVRQILSLIGFLLFIVWYRRYGQYSGWYPPRAMPNKMHID